MVGVARCSAAGDSHATPTVERQKALDVLVKQSDTPISSERFYSQENGFRLLRHRWEAMGKCDKDDSRLHSAAPCGIETAVREAAMPFVARRTAAGCDVCGVASSGGSR